MSTSTFASPPELGSLTVPVMWRAVGSSTSIPVTSADEIVIVPAVPESAVKPVLPQRPGPYAPESSE